MTIPTEAQIKAKDDSARERVFSDFMAKPTIRLLVSTLPAMEQQETIRTLLQEAHAFGWNGGSGQMMLMLLEGMMKPPNFPRS